MTLRTRDQERALHAYRCAQSVPERLREGYRTLVNGLGSSVLRNGLAAALAFLERDQSSPEVELLLKHLGESRIPGLETVEGSELPGKVRGLPLDGYMLATREMLHLVVWFRRAVQASFLQAPEQRDEG